MKFVERCQMADAVNDQDYANGSKQGGFIYSTGEDGKTAGRGQSEVGTIEETMDNGEKVSKLRCYGSMTYAGFKSYIYAGLPKNDPRVTMAMDWIGRNYTLAENPGAGKDGQYYFYVMFSRALDATGSAKIDTIAADGKKTPHDWQNDLIDQLATMQNEDGSFKSINARWMENMPVLISAYSLLALEHAARN